MRGSNGVGKQDSNGDGEAKMEGLERVGNKIGGDGVGAVGGMCGRQRGGELKRVIIGYQVTSKTTTLKTHIWKHVLAM